MRNLKQTKRFIFLFLLGTLLYSCSENEQFETKVEEQNNENFIELSQATEIGEEIHFATKTSNNKSKGNLNTSKKRTIKSVNQAKNNNGKTSYYIINYNEGGFILLSADNRTQPIIGYSKEGNFETDKNLYSLGLQFWTEDAKQQILEIQNSNIKQSAKEKIAWKQIQNILTNQSLFSKEPDYECYRHTETYTKGPLLSSKWHQNDGFNNDLSSITCGGYSRKVDAGCVPIAMGQVMKYYEYPTNYNWTSMPSNYGTTTTSNFILDIHNAIKNEYSAWPSYDCYGTSVASQANMGHVLKTQFSYSRADWANFNYRTVINNISYNKPVILSGDNGNTGHMWVCEGYRRTTFHFDDCTGVGYLHFYMNWGWGGSNNGWFSFNNFNPANTHYNNNKKMIYNITP